MIIILSVLLKIQQPFYLFIYVSPCSFHRLGGVGTEFKLGFWTHVIYVGSMMMMQDIPVLKQKSDEECIDTYIYTRHTHI